MTVIPTGAVSPTSRVWYAAYGSNTLRARLLAYIRGCGADLPYGVHTGGRNPAPPERETALVLPHALYFAGDSKRWSGPVAFVTPTREPSARTYGRAYLLQWQQIEDLIAHENGHNGIAGITELPEVGAGTELEVQGKYNLLVRLDDVHGAPAVTLTTSRALPRGAPPTGYLDAMRAGLAEAGGCTDRELIAYFDRLACDRRSGAHGPGSRSTQQEPPAEDGGS